MFPFCLDRDPTLLSYFGLAGENNRRKLAERFKRPTSWKEYCDTVSTDNCATPDDISKRAPDDTEFDKYFADELYTGHFRMTDKNNCTANPDTCTGHITDYPCGWSSNVKPVTYWNNIALESNGPVEGPGGYGYSQMVEIMRAANATKSDHVILWWFPDLEYQRYLGSDAELVKVTLPTVTQLCLDNQISAEDRCVSDEETRNGNKWGSCDDPPMPLQKVIGSFVHDMSKDPSKPEELHSPVYDVLTAFSLTSYQIGQVCDLYADVIYW